MRTGETAKKGKRFLVNDNPFLTGLYNKIIVYLTLKQGHDGDKSRICGKISRKRQPDPGRIFDFAVGGERFLPATARRLFTFYRKIIYNREKEMEPARNLGRGKQGERMVWHGGTKVKSG